jgi:catechol 2,3-dioxygenase-like lactoylglutathione lyase family enzyme
MVQAAIPMLPVRNLEEAVVFLQRLGWAERHRFPGYAITAREDVEIHVFEYPDLLPLSNDGACYIRVSDVRAFHNEFEESGIERLGPLVAQEWGMHEFTVVDPSGNLFRFGSPLD